jgi:hypothetical protein
VTLLAVAEHRLGVADRRAPDHRDPTRILRTRVDVIRSRTKGRVRNATPAAVTETARRARAARLSGLPTRRPTRSGWLAQKPD